MAVFYSSYHNEDNWHVQQVCNIGTIDNTDTVAAQE